MMERISVLHRQGIEIVVVEHVMDVIKRLCEHVYVLANGKIIAEGTPAALRERAGKDNLEEAFLASLGREDVEVVS